MRELDGASLRMAAPARRRPDRRQAAGQRSDGRARVAHAAARRRELGVRRHGPDRRCVPRARTSWPSSARRWRFVEDGPLKAAARRHPGGARRCRPERELGHLDRAAAVAGLRQVRRRHGDRRRLRDAPAPRASRALMCRPRYASGAVAAGVARRAMADGFKGDMPAIYDKLRAPDCPASAAIEPAPAARSRHRRRRRARAVVAREAHEARARTVRCRTRWRVVVAGLALLTACLASFTGGWNSTRTCKVVRGRMCTIL